MKKEKLMLRRWAILDYVNMTSCILLLFIMLQVVMSFWKAIGGDEDEVCVDSSSDSEHNS